MTVQNVSDECTEETVQYTSKECIDITLKYVGGMH